MIQRIAYAAAHTATYCNILHHTVKTLQNTATHCNTLHTATRCNSTRCNTRQHTATHCNTLKKTATHTGTHTANHTAAHLHVKRLLSSLITLLRPHTATHYITLQHTATYYNTQRMTHCKTHCNTHHTSTSHINGPWVLVKQIDKCYLLVYNGRFLIKTPLGSGFKICIVCG